MTWLPRKGWRSEKASPRSEVARSASPLGHRPPLDGLRGLAILGVLLLHASIWGAAPQFLPGGNLGVTVFFVLSGYLITTLLLEEHKRRDGIDLRAFYLRRAARLLPGLLLVLPLYVVVFWQEQTSWQLILTIGSAALYLGSFVQAFWGAMGPLGWTWSLSVEEQFYLCWPPILRWLLRRSAGSRRQILGWPRRHPLTLAAGVATTVVAVTTCLRIALSGSFHGNEYAYYASFTRMDALALGCLVALFARRYPHALPRPVGWLALPLICWSYANPAFGIGATALDVYGLPLASFAAAALILTVVNEPHGLIARVFSFRPLTHLGAISYGLYLWNLLPGQTWHVIYGQHAGVAGTLALLVAVVVMAELSYWFVERPVLRWAKARRSRVESGAVLPARRISKIARAHFTRSRPDSRTNPSQQSSIAMSTAHAIAR